MEVKKYFNYFFAFLIVSLSLLIYLQWFSPSKPFQYFTPLEDKIPKIITSLPVLDVDGKESLVEMKDSPYTVFIVEYAEPIIKEESYPDVSKFQEIISKQGIRMIYLWKIVTNTDKESTERIRSLVEPSNYDAKYILNNRLLAKYKRDLGLEISSTRLVFAYNDKGELVYQNSKLFIGDIISEVMRIPKNNELSN